MTLIGIDFETASTANLKVVGNWRYSLDPSTIVYCAAFEGGTWEPGQPPPRFPSDAVFLAHNSPFERSIWTNVLHPRFGWPECPERWEDSQAHAAAANLPITLEGLGAALGTPVQKDKAGHDLMLLMSKLTAGEKNVFDTAENRARLLAYCVQDVRTMLAIWQRVPKMIASEAALWRLDQKINHRGVFLDRDFVRQLQRMADKRMRELKIDASEETEGDIWSSASTPAVKKWLTSKGVELPKASRVRVTGEEHESESIGRHAVLGMLEGATPEVRAVLENRLEASKATSLAKLKKVEQLVDPRDGRLRNSLQFCGAHTGRWSSRGLQVHNLPRDKRPEEEVARVRELVAAGDLQGLSALVDRPLEALSMSLRGVIAAAPGMELIGADFSAIEARVLAWLAGQHDVLSVLADPKQDVYVYAAKKIGSGDRQLGKVLTLACGYGMGPIKFRDTAAGYGLRLTLKEARTAVLAWRKSNTAIVDLWQLTEDACREAIASPGRVVNVGAFLKVAATKTCLMVQLPSGRAIRYWRPTVRTVMKEIETVDEDGEIVKLKRESTEIVFFTPGKNAVDMVQESTYSGKLCLAGDSLVLTRRGWVPLAEVRRTDEVHDGVDFVNHGGILYNGTKTCLALDGVWMTPDHEVLTHEGWRTASSKPRPYRPAFWTVGRDKPCTLGRQEAVLELPVRLRSEVREVRNGDQEVGEERMASGVFLAVPSSSTARKQDAWNGEASGVLGVEVNARSMPVAGSPSVEELRRERDSGVRPVGRVRDLLERHGSELRDRADVRPDRQREGILTGELPVGHVQDADVEQTEQHVHRHSLGQNNGERCQSEVRPRLHDLALPHHAQVAEREAVSEAGPEQMRRVYDITQCGPRRRFVVLGDSGPFIVHNCENVTQGVARDLLGHGLTLLEEAGYPPVVHVHDSAASEVPTGFGSPEKFSSIMARVPSWAPGLPLAASGYRDKRFRG